MGGRITCLIVHRKICQKCVRSGYFTCHHILTRVSSAQSAYSDYYAANDVKAFTLTNAQAAEPPAKVRKMHNPWTTPQHELMFPNSMLSWIHLRAKKQSGGKHFLQNVQGTRRILNADEMCFFQSSNILSHPTWYDEVPATFQKACFFWGVSMPVEGIKLAVPFWGQQNILQERLDLWNALHCLVCNSLGLKISEQCCKTDLFSHGS